jgi:hypothetical protein
MQQSSSAAGASPSQKTFSYTRSFVPLHSTVRVFNPCEPLVASHSPQPPTE